jgi:hypothetical protein
MTSKPLFPFRTQLLVGQEAACLCRLLEHVCLARHAALCEDKYDGFLFSTLTDLYKIGLDDILGKHRVHWKTTLN